MSVEGMRLIVDELYKELVNEGDEIDKMLNGYIAYLKKSKQGANEPGTNYSVHEEDFLYATGSEENITTGEETAL